MQENIQEKLRLVTRLGRLWEFWASGSVAFMSVYGFWGLDPYSIMCVFFVVVCGNYYVYYGGWGRQRFFWQGIIWDGADGDDGDDG
jgi:hypothetical protein